MELGKDFSTFSKVLQHNYELATLKLAIQDYQELTGKSRHYNVMVNFCLFGVVDDPVCRFYKRQRTKVFL